MLAQTFHRLDDLLWEYRQWWQFQPFHTIHSRWQSRAPTLHAALIDLTPGELAIYIGDANRRRLFLQQWIPVADELHRLCQLPHLQSRSITNNRQLEHGVGGRKWDQITAFAGLVPTGQPIVEWCSGKGHLGRLLAADGATRVDSLERETALCKAGEKLAARAGVTMTFHHCDVLRDQLDGLLSASSHTVALHACGQLHMQLLQQVVARGGQAVSVAPCCYYLIDEERYTPLSIAGQRSGLQLYKSDLHIPLRETVTGGARASRLRSLELRWRLAFDCLQRGLREEDAYLPLPTIPRKYLGGSATDFIHWAIDRKGLPPASAVQIDDCLLQAEARLPALQQMELVQQLFQRPLELWLALDRALYLEENGYQVVVGEFCERRLTPRNILIQASRVAA
tara:strand:- start:23550 stop:24737 length:1188 start_codon:yes stop_codon:yes gene_type:complete